MTHNEREELMARITESWRAGYEAGMTDCHDEAEMTGCVEKMSKTRAVLHRLRHPFNGGHDGGE